MSIPTVQSKKIFSMAYLQAYKERIPAPGFLKSFFDVKKFATKYVGIEVQRGSERIASDVVRGADGNRNTFSRSSEKQYMPPFFNENFDATQLDRYDIGFNQMENATPETIGYLGSDVADKLVTLREKIERAKEKQCSEVFETGVVTMNNGDNIDYKRKSGSIVDLGGGDYWTNSDADIDGQFQSAGEFIRNYGKNATGEINAFMSTSALNALKTTDWFKNRADFRQVRLVDLNMAQRMSTGATLHGTVTAGSYIVYLWTYDEVYENSSGVITRYWPEEKVCCTPVGGSRFELLHAGVPAIIRDANNAEFPQFIQDQAAEYYINNYIDEKAKSHTFEIYSAPLAVPVTIDQIYTMKVKA